MEIAITVAVFGVAALFVLFILARKLMRLAVRLLLLGLLALILVAGSLFWWSGSNPTEQNANRTSAPQRRNTNAR
mgnify:CR=1 FL=1